MITKFTVSPFEGILPLKLAATEQEISGLIGGELVASGHVPRGVKRSFLITTGQMLDAVFIDGKAAELTISPGPVPVFFRDVDLLSSGVEREALTSLLSAQPDPRESYGTLVFDRLGIAVTGFHNEDEANKAASVFVQGFWADVSRLPFAKLNL